MNFSLSVSAMTITFAYLIYTAFRRHRSSLPLPPGPKPRFLYGNANDIPNEKPWIEFHDWGRKFGGFIYFAIFRTKFLVINDYKTAIDLLDSRSLIYSDRPQSIMVELIGWGFNMTFFNYGAEWKEQRRAMHQNLNNRAVREWRQVQQDATHIFLKKLATNPDAWLHRIEHLTASAIMKFTYGYDLKENDDYIPVAKKAIDAMLTTQGIGFIVDKLPFFPSWFPGAHFKKFVEAQRPYCEKFLEWPFKITKDLWLSGRAENSYVTRLFEEYGGAHMPKEKEQIIKESSAVMYAAGTDSTYSVLASFFLALTLYPEVQKQSRAEIDRVIGRGRFPSFADRASLPYIEAVVKELLRWNPAAPLGPSHQILVDDEYKGCLIPAGTIIHPNIWSMSHNEDMYSNSFEFNPERFLDLDEEKSKALDPRNFVFGFGRRICVGQFFADQQIWLAVACLVATVDIKKARDESGEEITPIPNYPGFAGTPDPFPCVVTIRDEIATKLIEDAHGGV